MLRNCSQWTKMPLSVIDFVDDLPRQLWPSTWSMAGRCVCVCVVGGVGEWADMWVGEQVTALWLRLSRRLSTATVAIGLVDGRWQEGGGT